VKISVALCTYNGEKYIEEQIDSILNQTLKVDEIVICDDLSSDKTHEIIEKYKALYPNTIRFYINDVNLRSVKNFEKAISLCTGEIIFLSDQDDLWADNKVAFIHNKFVENPNISCYATNGFIMDEKSIVDKKILTIWEVPKILKVNNEQPDFFKMICCYNNFVTGASMAFRAKLNTKILPIPNVIKDFHHDEWIALIAAENNNFDFIDEKLFTYRVHSNQQVGGVTYKNSNSRITYFQNVFSFKTGFGTKIYKRKLKLLSNNFKKFNTLKKLSTDHFEFFDTALTTITKTFHQTNVDFKKDNYLGFHFTKFLDYFLNKRKLNS
jgi:glycosyltransferase involved in cell wall biosynthesis